MHPILDKFHTLKDINDVTEESCLLVSLHFFGGLHNILEPRIVLNPDFGQELDKQELLL